MLVKLVFVLIVYSVTIKSESSTVKSDELVSDDCRSLIDDLQQNSKDVNGLNYTTDVCLDKVIIHELKCSCRQDTYVFLEWNIDYVGPEKLGLNNVTYLVEKWSLNGSESDDNWLHHSWTTRKKYKVSNLVQYSEYKFRVTPYLKDIRLGKSAESELITTFSGNESLAELKNVKIEKFFSDNSSVNALLIWDPLEDFVCEVTVVVAMQDSFGPLDIKKIVAENSMVINDLSYESSCSVFMYSSVGKAESDKIDYLFRVPSCLIINNYNLSKCAPDTPRDLKVNDGCTNFTISWNKPIAFPDYYTLILHYGNIEKNYTVQGNETSLKFDVDHIGDIYFIYIIAFGPAGESKPSFVNGQSKCSDIKQLISNSNQFKNKENSIITGKSPSKGKTIMILVFLITVPVIIILIMIWRIFFCFKTLQKDVDMMQPEDSFRKDVRAKTVEIIEPDKPCKDDKSEVNDVIYDEYEVGRDNIRLCQILGEGEFGVVHKAVLVANNSHLTYVAVKTLRNKESVEEKRQLRKEMDVMKSVGKHRNIVSLLGCCTEDMMLIVEYCSLGDLRRFLRKTWRIKSYAEEAFNEISNKDLLERRAFSNILYEQSVSEKRYLDLSMMDLLSFARQTALGMAYLSENRVVHRDVAARNVLLADDMTAKIADFGLSRDVYERNIYMKSSTDKLPLRWMALESLQYQVFSTKSDVWSYGILLWEIMTLGGCPYPSLQTSEMYKLLQEGYRMERPKPCNFRLYQIMLNCWDAKPQNRPSFAQLVLGIEQIMKNESNRSYLDLSTCDYKNHLDDGLDFK